MRKSTSTRTPTRALRVCYFGTYRASYSRNEIMIEGLRRNGVEVVECHEPLWHGFEDRERMAAGGWVSPAFWWRVARTYARLLLRYARLRGRYDVLVVGYPGQIDILLARLLTALHRRPLVWDVFMSIYLIALERRLEQRSRATVGFIRWLERTAYSLADLPILDTAAYVAWFSHTHRVAPQRFRLVPTGADDRVFQPPGEPGEPGEPDDAEFRIVYYGTFIPNHGVLHMVEAARLLADDPAYSFEFIGYGPDKPRAMELAEQYGLARVSFPGWLKKDALIARVARAHLCLGAFGTTPQSLMTVQNKIYEALALAKPMVTGDSAAVREALTHGEHLYLCARADPHALAAAIRHLRSDAALRAHLAREGHRVFVEHYGIAQIGGHFARHLEELVMGDR